MTEQLSEQQSHLKNLLDQRATLIAEINELNSTAAAKRELVLRALGAIEYLQQIGVELPAPPAEEVAPVEGEVAAPAEGEVPPTPETEAIPAPTVEG